MVFRTAADRPEEADSIAPQIGRRSRQGRSLVGTRVVVLPGRPPATTAASSPAPLPTMPPGNDAMRMAPPGLPPSAMAR